MAEIGDWIPDKSIRGLYQRVRQTKTTWAVKARIRSGRNITFTIGDASVISAVQARKEAKIILAKTASGIDPSIERKTAKLVADARNFTFGKAIVDYTRLSSWGEKTKKDSLETLQRRFEDWYSRPLATITREDCLNRFRKIKTDVAKRQIAIDERMEKAGNPRKPMNNEYGIAEAQKAFRIVNAIFSSYGNDSAGSEKLLPQGNPVLVLKDKKQRHALKRRDNFLDIEQRENLLHELSIISHGQYDGHCTQDDADLVWLLLHTGCRFREIKDIRWENIDLTKETLTALDTKNKTDHILPMTEPIKKVLERRYKDKRGAFVFPSPIDIKKPMSAGASFKRLSDAIGFRFSAHDLRRTLATVALEQGADLDSIGRVLNHKKQGANAITSGYAQTTLRHLRGILERVAEAFFEPIIDASEAEEKKL